MDEREVRLTRVYAFSASHRLDSPFLSEEENMTVYGKCGRTSGHGHNYILKVTVKGRLDGDTGMVTNISQLDDVVNRNIISALGHKNLNMELCDTPILTSEVLIKVVWDRIAPEIKSVKLCKIAIEETRKNSFEFYGN